MVLLPVGSADVLKEAAPLPLSGTWASTLLHRWKVTMPVGTPVPGGTDETVAVKVTGCPTFEGLGVEATIVDESLAWMNCTSDELPALKLTLPLYWAVMKCLSAVSPEVVMVAWPARRREVRWKPAWWSCSAVCPPPRHTSYP